MNICAVRCLIENRNLTAAYPYPDPLPHEPVLFTEEMKQSAMSQLPPEIREDHPDLRFQTVGTPLLRSGMQWCKYCGCFFTTTEGR